MVPHVKGRRWHPSFCQKSSIFSWSDIKCGHFILTVNQPSVYYFYFLKVAIRTSNGLFSKSCNSNIEIFLKKCPHSMSVPDPTNSNYMLCWPRPAWAHQTAWLPWRPTKSLLRFQENVLAKIDEISEKSQQVSLLRLENFSSRIACCATCVE